MDQPILQVNVTAGYKKHTTLRDVRFELQPGECLGLVGSSGAGKSTLVLALLGLLPWHGGRAGGKVMFGGQNLLELSEKHLRTLRGKQIGFIPQSPLSALNSCVSLLAHFEAAWKAHSMSGSAGLRPRMQELLASVQLPSDADFLTRRPNQISVGQAQRVCIALALLHCPQLLIADEPTSALDPVNQAEILGLLQKLKAQTGTSLLFISHDLLSVLQLCDRVAVLHAGSIVESLASEHLEQASHDATRALLGALPVPASVLLAHRRPKQHTLAIAS